MEHIRIRRTARNLRERFQSPAQQRWGTEPCRIYGARNGRILLPMTRHKHTHTGLVTPSLPQLLLTAMLHLFAMLVSSVASTLQMTRRRLAAECHSDVTPADLPRETTDTHQEPEAVPQDGTLTNVSHTHNGSVHSVYASPAKAGVQSPSDRSARSAPSPFAQSLDPGLRRGCVLREHAT